MLAYLALGYSALQAERFGIAAELLRSARALPTPVTDYTDYHLALALEGAGDHAKAVQVLSGFESQYPDSALKSRAIYALAASLLETGQPAKSASLLSARLESLPRPAADLLLARAYERQGDLARAARAYSTVYFRYPASKEAEEAGQRKQIFPSPSPADLRARAEALAAAAAHGGGRTAQRLHLEAHQAYGELAAASLSAERELALVVAAAELYHANHTQAALAALEPLAPASAEAAAQRLYWIGECHRRQRREPDFLAQVRLLGERYATSSWHEEALFSAGNFLMLHEDLAAAAAYYAAVYQRFPGGKYAAQSHWKVAWARYREGHLDEARRLMQEQVARYAFGPQFPAALYWAGRVTETAEPADPVTAESYFRKVAQVFPQSFYGGLARQRLGNMEFATASPRMVIEPPARITHRVKVTALKSAWLMDLAATELRYAADEDAAHHQYWLLELARLERERGRYHVAIDRARQVFSGYLSYQLDQLARQDWELLFPLPWWGEIRSQSAREGLDAYLVAGLIRQESAFNPEAVSSAQARGLMQLLPSVGRRLARRMGQRRFRVASLFDPQVNIHLGTVYLRQVFDHFGGRREEALAAYNAGNSRVEAWRAAGYREPAEFIESIPITETREYIQAVVRNAVLYRKLYAPGAESAALR